MKSFARLTLLLLLSASLVTSCKKAVPKQIRHIPKSALFVATVNTKSLQNKLVKNQATIENILKSAAGSDTSASKGRQEWEDLKESGIDLDENFYMAVVQKGGGMADGKGTTVISGVGTLKDEAKLQAYIKKKQPKSEVRKEKDYSYTTIEGDKMVAWNSDLVVVMTYQKGYGGEMEYDSATGSYNMKSPASSQNDMKAEMTSYFNLKEDESVANIPEFRDLMQDKGDLSFWINSSSSMDNLVLPLPKLKELFGSTFTAASVNFEDGKVTANTKSYYSPQLRDILKKYSGNNANLNLIEQYPSNNINGFAAISFNPELFNALVKYLEVGGMVDGYLTKMMGVNYTLQDALKAIKGDIAIIVSDFAVPAADTTGAMRIGSAPKVKMILNIPVGDKVQMNRLMDKMVEMQFLVKENNQYSLNPSMRQMGWQVSVDDKNLLVSSEEALLTQYKSNSKKAVLNKDVMDNFKDKPGAFYVNIEGMLNGVGQQSSAEINNVLPKAKETFKDIIAYSENFNGKYAEGKIEFRFKNEKENSLTSILNFAETVSKNVPKNEPPMSINDLSTDTTAVADPK